LFDLAVMLADGGECISDIATLADRSEVFGPVASDSTCWRVLDAVSDADLGRRRTALWTRARTARRRGADRSI
jgi:hypothetical protein